jgi:hypothetical protein
MRRALSLYCRGSAQRLLLATISACSVRHRRPLGRLSQACGTAVQAHSKMVTVPNGRAGVGQVAWLDDRW